MRVEQHYDDEVLISFLASAPGAVQRDPHLAGCRECSETLESLQMIAGALGEESVWAGPELSDEPNPNTIATLRAFADAMAHEEAFAAPVVASLLATPRATWMAQLAAHPEWRTAGVVRHMVDAVEAVLMRNPTDAVELLRVATDIADNLRPSNRDAEEVARLRGAAWRQRAFAYFYVGQFNDAVQAIDVAQEAYRHVAIAEYDIARLDIVRALVFREFDRDREAVEAVRRSIHHFAVFGDMERQASAQMTSAHMLMKFNDYRGALEVLGGAEKQLGSFVSERTRARLLGNIAWCLGNLGKFDEALQNYQLTTEIFTALNIPSEVVRVKLNIAALLRDAGRLEDAARQFTGVIDEFSHLGMAAEAAIGSLDLAELLLAKDRHAEADALCRASMKYFEKSGLEHSARALTALAYIREAAEARRVTPQMVSHVKQYIRRLPAEPKLLFLPPPV
jgi:tetratricopeptide (TPR) repeat protein